jgi:cation transport ATPase
MDNANWQPLASVLTGGDGAFTYSWTPSKSGTYLVRAFWPGDAEYTAASQTVTVSIEDPAPYNSVESGNTQTFFKDVVDQLKGVPLIAVPVELAGSLLVLGASLATILTPDASPLVGYFLGSLFLGFVFVFPISALALSFKAARRHRSPSILWLIPLATMWIAALLVLSLSGVFLAAPQALFDAAAILLVASNTFLVPLTFSLFLAKAVAG